jgi:hypothetical protein
MENALPGCNSGQQDDADEEERDDDFFVHGEGL